MSRTGSSKDRLAAARSAVRRPVVVDAAVVLGTLAVVLGHERWVTGTQWWQPALFDLALVLPLAWRRHRPTAVFLVIAAVALVQWFTGVQASGDLVVLIALYAVGAHERRRIAIGLCAAIALLGVVLAMGRWAPPGEGLSATLLGFGTVTAAWVLGVYLRTHRAYLASVLDRAATAERERDQQALIATVTERARISREMHDIVAHSLSVMIALGDGAAISAVRAPEAARDAMQKSSALGRQALGDMRRLLGSLNADDDDDHDHDHDHDGIHDGGPDGTELAPQPGIAQLDGLVDQVRSAGLAVDLVVTGHPPELAPGAQLTVYRMVQEALTNVLKHAPSASRAVVTLAYGDDGVDIQVDNDNPAPDRVSAARGSAYATSEGHGIAGMRARAAAFDGTVQTVHRADGGWRVSSHLRFGDPESP